MKQKIIVAVGCVSVLVTCGLVGPAFAHGDDPRVAMERDQEGNVQAGRIAFTFQLVDSERGKVLTDSDLRITHEKKLHVLLFDPGLREFRHEHPVFNGAVWELGTELSATGNYFVWAQGELVSDGEEFTTGIRLNVVGGAPAHPVPPVLGEVRMGSDGISSVSVSKERLIAKKGTMLTLKFGRTDGSSATITPYLGALAHVVGVLHDGDTLIHVHPMSGSRPDEMMIHTEFPASGDYRLWIQFIDGGELRVVPLSVSVF